MLEGRPGSARSNRRVSLGFVISCGFQIHEILHNPHSPSPRNNFTPLSEEVKEAQEEATKPQPHEKAEPVTFLTFIGHISRKLHPVHFRYPDLGGGVVRLSL